MRHVTLMMTALAMTGCVSTGGSETERTLCRELKRDLPTASSADTEQTKQELADFLDVFHGVCP